MENPISLSIYPNPVSENLFIQFEALNSGSMDINILNSQGQIVYENHQDIINERAISTNIDISKLQKGVYILQLKDEVGNTQQKKFVVN
jgi:hypothetical protein